MSESHSTEVEYRAIAGYPGYRVGDDGSVWSCWKRGVPGKVGGYRLSDEWIEMRGQVVKGGYLRIILSAGAPRTFFVHVLVLNAFKGPCPPGMQCAHFNGNPADNRLSNLRWDTPLSNAADRNRHGTMVRGSKHRRAKITEQQVQEIRRRVGNGERTRDLASEFGVTQKTIRELYRCERSWVHVPGTPPPPRIYPTVCIVQGCDKRPVGRGWCRKHYSRWKRGQPVC